MCDPTIAKKQARDVILLGVLLLALLMTGYYYLHRIIPSSASSDDAAKNFFYSTGKIKGICQDGDATMKKLAQAVLALPEDKCDAFACEFKDSVKYLKGYASSFAAYSSIKVSPTDQRVITVLNEVDAIDSEARLLSANDGYFWSAGPYKWLEIVFWGEFGVIIGILAWVSTQMENGTYKLEVYEKEKYWYLTEVIIAPAVVAAVFFLLSGIAGAVMEGVTKEEVSGSVHARIAVSFTLGMFIRRSLGVFDWFKDKLPRPKSS